MYTSDLHSFSRTPELMHRYLPDLKLIYIVRHPLDRIVSQWRHYRGRNPECADFSELMRDRHLRRLIVGCSMYYQRLSAFRRFYPDEQIHCMTFEDLLSSPRRSLRQIMQFLGVKPRVKRLLDSNGQLPRENQAGEKGRGHVEKPHWSDGLKRRVLRRIRPDSEQMLAYMGKPTTTGSCERASLHSVPRSASPVRTCPEGCQQFHQSQSQPTADTESGARLADHLGCVLEQRHQRGNLHGEQPHSKDVSWHALLLQLCPKSIRPTGIGVQQQDSGLG